MKRRAVIHIGTFKTGSTSIQYFLDQNRNLLKEGGYFVPQSLGAPNHHGLAVYALSYREVTGLIRFLQLEERDAREQARANFVRMLSEEMQALDSKTHTVLFSNEHLSGLNTVGEIKTLRDLLAPHFDEFKILVYLRRQDQRIISDYTQKVRDGYTKPLDILNYEPAESTDYFSFIAKWAEVFGEEAIAPRIFARQNFQNGDLIDDFCLAAEIPIQTDFERPASENTGLSHKATQFLRAINEFIPARKDGSPNKFRERLLPYLASSYPGRGITPDPKTANKLLERVRANNEALGEKYFSGGDPFPAFSPSNNTDDDLTIVDAVEISAELWTKQSTLIEELRCDIRRLGRENNLLRKSNGSDVGLELLLDLFQKNDPAWNDYFPSLISNFEMLCHDLAHARERIKELERAAASDDCPPSSDNSAAASVDNTNRDNT